MNEEQLRRMISFVGYGDYVNAKILFFGNEEGTAGCTTIQEAIDTRCNQYYNQGIPLFDDNPYNGFYTTVQNNVEGGNNVHMLKFQSRLMLHLREPDVDWFQLAADEPALYLRINNYRAEELYRENPQFIKSALFDLKPLPRPNEGVWPIEYRLILNKRLYLRAFSYGNPGNIPEMYLSYRNNRLGVIKELLRTSENAPVLIGIGAKNVKKRFFCMAYPEINFEERLLHDQICYHGILNFEDRQLHVFLCNFFDYRSFNLQALGALGEIIYPLVIHE